MKKQRGITLIALVLTIIILLILAGVAIATLTGDNGLLTKAETAVQSNKDSQELEKIKLAVAAAQLAGQGSITTDNLNGELRENFSDNSLNVDEKSGGWFFKQNKEYTIFHDGKIQEGNLLLLPKEYQQVEYIESSGTQYIDTEFIPDNKTKCVIIYQFLEVPLNDNVQIGCGTIDNTNRNRFNYGIAIKDTNRCYIGVGSQNIISMNDTEKIRKHNIILDSLNQTANIDENLINNFSSFNTEGLDFYLFTRNQPDTSIERYIHSGRCYSLIFYKNNLLVAEYIPCYRISDNAIGMYNTVEGKFYVNKGTGTFGYETEDGTYVAPTNN